MKKILVLSMIVASGLIYHNADAQVRISAQININSQPDWGPSGYDYAPYYYLPEADMYYNVGSREYVYLDRGRWVNVRVLPPYLRGFNLYNSYKVVINDRNPWTHHDMYRRQYVNYRGRHDQVSRRDYRGNGRRDMAWDDRRNDSHRDGGYYRDNDHGRSGGRDDHGRGDRDRNDRGNGHRW